MPRMYERVLICGGRDFADDELFRDTMNAIGHNFFRRCEEDDHGNWMYNITVIQGGAPGADMLAYNWCLIEWVPCKEYKADWDKHGKKAGYLRNKQMLEEGQPDLVIAFPGGKGTAMMIGLARKAGVRVFDVSHPPKFRTEKFEQKYLRGLQNEYHTLSQGHRDRLFWKLYAQEDDWLEKLHDMDAEYNEIMDAQELAMKIQDLVDEPT